MIKRIQKLPRWQRIIIFTALVLAMIALIIGITLPIVAYSYNDTPRSTPLAMQDNITIREFAALPDDDSYPAALAIAQDGTLYTASYVSGAVWQISPDGIVTEIPNTKETIGAVTGLDIAPDGTLYILDRIKPLETLGAIVWKITPGNPPENILQLDKTALQLPYDIAVDENHVVYISDVLSHTIQRYNPATDTVDMGLQLTQDNFPTRLFYDSQEQTLLISDTRQNTVYAVSTTLNASANAVTTRYEYTLSQEALGFDGIAIGTENTLFVAVLSLNRVAKINLQTNEWVYLAGAFRGSSDIAYDAARNRLYVANWEQRALLPEPFLIFQIDIQPHLPFTIDMIEWDS